MNGKALEQRTTLAVFAWPVPLHWDSLPLTLLQGLSHWLTGAVAEILWAILGLVSGW